MPQIQFIQRTDRAPEYLQTGLSALARTNELNLARAKELYDMSHSLPPSIRVAVRNRAYKLAGIDGYQESFEKQQPKESDEDLFARLSGAVQNPKGIAGAPGYDQALTNSVNEAVPEIRSVRKLAKPLPGGITEQAYMAGLTQPEIDEDAIPDNQMNRIMTPEEYDRSTMNTDAGRAMADAYARRPLAELEGDFVPPVAQSAAQPQVRSEAYKGDPMMRAGGEIDDPVKAQQILDFYVRKYDNPSDSRQNALAMAARLGLSQKNLYQIDSFFQGEHMKQHGVTRLNESMQRSYAPSGNSGSGTGGGNGREGYIMTLSNNENGTEMVSKSFNKHDPNTAAGSLAMGISLLKQGNPEEEAQSAKTRLSLVGLSPDKPIPFQYDSKIESALVRNLDASFKKEFGEATFDPDNPRYSAWITKNMQSFESLYKQRLAAVANDGSNAYKGQYDWKTHKENSEVRRYNEKDPSATSVASSAIRLKSFTAPIGGSQQDTWGVMTSKPALEWLSKNRGIQVDPAIVAKANERMRPENESQSIASRVTGFFSSDKAKKSSSGSSSQGSSTGQKRKADDEI